MAFRIIAFNHHTELLKLYSTNLSARGFEILTFHEDMRSFERIEQHQPDLVILGDFGGIGSQDMELLTNMREHPYYKEIPIIIATTTPANHLAGIEQLASVYVLTKPFDIKLLVDMVRQALQGKLKPA